MSYESNEAVKGSRINPYTQGEMDALADCGGWRGGWVRDAQTNGVYYVRTDFGTEQDERYPLGSRDNPYSFEAYGEMVKSGIWTGGWTKEKGELVYHRSLDETSGSGSAYGSGCGSGFESGGCGLIAGSERFRPDGCHISLEVEVSWGSGSFLNGQTPPLSVTVILHAESPFDGVSAVAVWDGNYHVKILSADFPTIYYNIPERYRC